MNLLVRLLLVGVFAAVAVVPLWAEIRSEPSVAAASATINPSLGQPTSLTLQGLDSTIRANWTPSTDPNIAWQVFSAWDAGTLILTKVLSKVAVAADANGLQSNHSYTIQVQSMDASGA